jgi:P4 family phage/plasmid primase-like protien
MSYDKLSKFMNNKFITKGQKATHTRIGNKLLNITGGAYNIDYSDEKTFKMFIKKYTACVFKNKYSEYLTELQDKENGGPILIDLDFKLKKDTKERIFDADVISDIIETYIDKINYYFDLTNVETFEIFVLLKDEMVKEKDYIKDGIHIQINLKLKHDKQLFLRKKIMNTINDEIFNSSGFEFTNDLDDIFDKSISSGNTGWLMYGSKKPGGEPYKLKYKFTVHKDIDDEFEIVDNDIKDETKKSLVRKLLIRNCDFQEIIIKKEFENEIKEIKKIEQNTVVIKENHIGKDWIIKSFKNICSEEQCDNVIDIILSNEIHSLSNISEMKDYIMLCLDEKYYDPFPQWIRVLWALKNVNSLLYPFFLKWSAQSDKFDWVDTENIENIYKQWCGCKGKGLTEGSIRYWARESNPTEYQIIRDNTTKYYIEKTLEGKGTDNDIATLIYHLLFDRYRCTSIKSNRWYQFTNHRWIVSESGTGLRRKFSSMISPLYIQKQTVIMEQIREDSEMTQETQDRLTTEAAIYNKISMRLKDTSQKNNIMVESKELHYDNKLEAMLDENPMLISFKNGVYDFEQATFRDGIPEDYISKSTNIDYIEIDENKDEHKKLINEINDFMKKLFPNETLREYMWQHLASCLLGTNQNQTFNIYTGVGSNGKSVFVKLFGMVLGDYKGTVPISLITQKRLSIGGTSSEVAQLKGLRYAVMNEPSKGDVINEGIMKEITGGDPIQARELFKTSITFIPMFKLACCTNTLFDIKSNDEGTWRRIRVVDFESKFIDNPSKDPKDKEFKKDKTLEGKFESWAPIFASLLIKKVNKTKGKVEDCDEVLVASKKYRENQDYLAKFVADKIRKAVVDPNNPDKKHKISKSNIQREFKEWWSREYDTKAPKGKELTEYLEKILGPYPQKGRGWSGYEIIYDDYCDED